MIGVNANNIQVLHHVQLDYQLRRRPARTHYDQQDWLADILCLHVLQFHACSCSLLVLP